MTGSFLNAKNPLNVHMENITIDFSRFGYFYSTMDLQWNYPEANVESFTYFNNIVVENSNINKVGSQMDLIRSGDPGNFTATNIDARKWFFVGFNLHQWVGYITTPIWLPNDELKQYVTVKNQTISLVESGELPK